MKKLKYAISLSLASGISASICLPGSAVTFDFSNYDYSEVNNFDIRPIKSDSELSFFGDPAKNEGFVAYFNLDFTASDVGHLEISKNSPGNIAPYYTTGRQASPEDPSSGSTRSASLFDIAGFSNFSSYLTSNNLDWAKVGLSYGQKAGKAFTSAWNLGEDVLGQNWFANPESSVEERIYSATPEDVEISLSYENTPFVSFGYSDFYSVFDYGDTLSLDDDFDAILTTAIPAIKQDSLSPELSGLADAFLQDVDLAGGGVQTVYEQPQVQDPIFSVGNGYGVLTFPFPFSLRAVPLETETIPEPSSLIGLTLAGLWVAAAGKKSLKTR